MKYIGIDIGSTASKIYVQAENKPLRLILPTGWSSRETSRQIEKLLQSEGIDVRDKSRARVASTGYGRQAVGFADDIITEITCHGIGGSHLAGGDCTVIDIGGQDTKIISMVNGAVADFLMNDKCAAGTGKFVEIMANRLNVDLDELFSVAETGTVLSISSLCTVFAETEVINLIGAGRKREDIAAGIVDSVAMKVAGMCARQSLVQQVILTGGLSQNSFFVETLGKKIKRKIIMHPDACYAGAIGAMLTAQRRQEHN
ncbi:MAG: acyl-CoA dehydratase activase [Oscillospiraceae bacterium]